MMATLCGMVGRCGLRAAGWDGTGYLAPGFPTGKRLYRTDRHQKGARTVADAAVWVAGRSRLSFAALRGLRMRREKKSFQPAGPPVGALHGLHCCPSPHLRPRPDLQTCLDPLPHTATRLAAMPMPVP